MALFNDDYAFNSIIGPGSLISGNLRINGSVRIDGDLDGDLESSGNVHVGEKARVNGSIAAKSITVGGIVRGNITAPDYVHLLSSSLVMGDVQTHRLQSERGVIIHGHCISLTDEKAYAQAAEDWQDVQAIASRSILQNVHVTLDTAPVQAITER